MGLWNPLHRVMLIVAGVSVLAACYAVAAWGQAGADRQIPPGGGQQIMAGSHLPGSPTVSVVALRIPDSAWRHFEKAKSAADRHRDDEFERESARALAIAPRFAAMYMLRATEEMGTRRYDAALASAQAAVQADPGAMWTAVVLAGAYNALHRFNDARLVLNATHGFEAETWQAEYERARAETGAKDVAAALHWSGMALRAAPPECTEVRLVRTNALLLAGRFVEATAQIDIYLQSKGIEQHRGEVLALREAVKARIAAEDEAGTRAAIRTAPGGQTSSVGQTAPGAAQVATVQPPLGSR